MNDKNSFLISLLDREAGSSWSEELRRVLLSADASSVSHSPQHCSVHFALAQARRRLETSYGLGKRTFGMESLISVLEPLDKDAMLDYYVISTATDLGTCYLYQNRLLGCEFVRKSGTESKPGLWIDGKRIT